MMEYNVIKLSKLFNFGKILNGKGKKYILRQKKNETNLLSKISPKSTDSYISSCRSCNRADDNNCNIPLFNNIVIVKGMTDFKGHIS